MPLGGKGGGAGVERGSSSRPKAARWLQKYGRARAPAPFTYRGTVYRHVTSPSPQVRSGEPKTNFSFIDGPHSARDALKDAHPLAPESRSRRRAAAPATASGLLSVEY
jgi:hypothetical protein